jgi:hypothetical protein
MLLAVDLLAVIAMLFAIRRILKTAHDRATDLARGTELDSGITSAVSRIETSNREDMVPTPIWDPKAPNIAETQAEFLWTSLPVTPAAITYAADGQQEGQTPKVARTALSQSLMIEEKKYADPIDGMRFEPGESVIACSCGLEYREESIRWIDEHYKGSCVQCGAKIACPRDIA